LFWLDSFSVINKAALDPVGTEDLGISAIQRTRNNLDITYYRGDIGNTEHPSPKSEINVIPLRFNRNSSGQHVDVQYMLSKRFLDAPIRTILFVHVCMYCFRVKCNQLSHLFWLDSLSVINKAALDPVGTEDLGISTIQRTTWIYMYHHYMYLEKKEWLGHHNRGDPSFSGILQYPKSEITMLLAFQSKRFIGYVELKVP
jgi:hypothetical protein